MSGGNLPRERRQALRAGRRADPAWLVAIRAPSGRGSHIGLAPLHRPARRSERSSQSGPGAPSRDRPATPAARPSRLPPLTRIPATKSVQRLMPRTLQNAGDMRSDCQGRTAASDGDFVPALAMDGAPYNIDLALGKMMPQPHCANQVVDRGRRGQSSERRDRLPARSSPDNGLSRNPRQAVGPRSHVLRSAE